ncbi:hypothetical protein IWQ60_010664 [Tieghemiomyces parasiticus]|uniref:L-threonine 3-dehydrogenase, mitochondrial n=1 Tax=Tieghemiomyces parasiticus TaxID=78921 RepID=A0A9W8DMM6_9FUNG|nr:hypothetical protein IWQ60_010664 [Tieghemiomyces parasiticus]
MLRFASRLALPTRRQPSAILYLAAQHRALTTSLSHVASSPFAKGSATRTPAATVSTATPVVSARNASTGAQALQSLSQRPPRVLVTGSLGQLGLALVNEMRTRYGVGNVVASDIRKPTAGLPIAHPEGPFVYADVMNYPLLERIIVDFQIDWVVHYSAMLSAVAEKEPARALNVNITGFQNVLELSRIHKLRLFCPSTIGAFGPQTPKINTPDLTIMNPNTIYGITKVHMELLGEYYHEKFGVDFRSARYPGILSVDTMPGGGTTDYAIDIFHHALQTNSYNCFLKPETRLPMMYISDCIEGTLQLMEAPVEKLTQRVYNMAADSFTPAELDVAIREHYAPDFQMNYVPDSRQAIADSWPASLDDSLARRDWGWKPQYDTAAMVHKMWTGIAAQYTPGPTKLEDASELTKVTQA